MKALILGAGGFIGSNLIQHLLLTSEMEVLGLDSEDAKLANVRDPMGRFSFHKHDIGAGGNLLRRLTNEVDVVLDLIAYANPSLYVTQPLEVVDLNFFKNLEIVNMCIETGTRLIQFSSCEVYGMSGGSRTPFTEDGSNLTMGPVQNSRWIYACAKQLLERIIVAHGQREALNYVIIRPFNFVGPKIDYLVPAGTVGGPRVFSHFMSALLTGGPLQLVGGGLAHRSYTYIDDAVEGIRLVLENPDLTRNQILNIGSPSNGTTIRELAILMKDLFEELTGDKTHSPITSISSDAFYGTGYEDCDWRVPDIARMAALGWTLKHDLRSTFLETMKWHIEHYAPESLNRNPSR